MKKFTDTFINGLKCSNSNKRFEHYEGDGFGIRVSPKLKTWIYRYKFDNKTFKITLGYYPKMSLAKARQKHIELLELRKEKTNPRAAIEKEKAKAENTVEKLVNSWYQGYAIKSRKKPQQIKQQLESDIIPLLGKLPLDKIQTIDISNALDKIVKRGSPIQANRVLSTLKQSFNYGVSRGSLQTNPAASIRARDIGGLEPPRDRVLSLDEIKRLWRFLDSEHHNMSLAIKNSIKILLLTGVRTSELRLAKWEEFSFEESLWTIPAKNSKSNLTIKVHLSNLVKQLLIEIQQQHKECVFVLPGKSKSKEQKESRVELTKPDMPIIDTAIPKALSRIQERLGIPHWRAHDLRRTFSTHLGETLRIDPVVIEKCLGHKMPKIMATYNKNEMLPERKEALNAWSEHIENLVSENNVITFKCAI